MALMSVAKSKTLSGPKMTVPVFRPAPGKEYRMLFIPFQDDPATTMVLAENVHNISGPNDNGETVRCLHGHVVYEEEGSDVLKTTPAGNPINDGTCPYCKYWNTISQNVLSPRYQQWLDENPNASDNDKKKAWSDISGESPVKKSSSLRYFPVVVVEVDSRGMAMVNKEGKPDAQLMLYRLTEYNFQKLETAAEQYKKADLQRHIASGATGEMVESDGMAGREFVMTYPNTTDKMAMGLNLNIQTAQIPILDSIKDEFYQKAWETDYDKVDSEIQAFKAQSLEAAKVTLQPYQGTLAKMLIAAGHDPESLGVANIMTLSDSTISSMLAIPGAAETPVGGKAESQSVSTPSSAQSEVPGTMTVVSPGGSTGTVQTTLTLSDDDIARMTSI